MLQRNLCGLCRAKGTPSPAAHQLRSPGGFELTAEHMERAESAGAASILEASKPLTCILTKVVSALLQRQQMTAVLHPSGSNVTAVHRIPKCDS